MPQIDVDKLKDFVFNMSEVNEETGTLIFRYVDFEKFLERETEPSDKTVEELAHDDYPYGSTAGIGSKDRAMYESRKESYIKGYMAFRSRLIGCEKALEIIAEERRNLLEEVQLRDELIVALNEYATVLGKECDDNATFLTAHRIKSKRVQEGLEARAKIDEILNKLSKQV